MKVFKNTFLSLLLVVLISSCSGKSEASQQALIMEDITAAGESQEDNSGNPASEVPTEEAITEIVEQPDLHDSPTDMIWDEDSEVSIVLDDEEILAASENIAVNSGQVTISSAGTYRISGLLSEGQICVDSEDEAIVRIVLDNATIHNSQGPALYIANAGKVLIVLAEGSQNSLVDGSDYFLPDPESDEPNATLFSEDDLTITGSGSLSIESHYNDAVSSKDGLIINGGSSLNIHSVDDGIRGKDYVVIDNARIRINANGDGIKSDENEDPAKGFITINSGEITIVSGADGIEAETDVTINGGTFDLARADGRDGFVDDIASRKGIKATRTLTITGGSFQINTADDGLHSNDSMVIRAGIFNIATVDDGLHADKSITIDGGMLMITKSFEGIESAVITINAGNIDILSSDDGINLAGGADGSGMNSERRGGRGGPGEDRFTASGDYCLYINGGTTTINAGGDGIDSNGSINMSDGVVVIDGPTESMNGALDYTGTFNISGGIMVASGSAGMAMAPSDSSSQPSILINFDSFLRSDVHFHVENDLGETILNYAPTKPYQSVVISTPQLSIGDTIHIMVGGEVAGSNNEGMLLEGDYSGGSEVTSFTITDRVTYVGSRGRNFGR